MLHTLFVLLRPIYVDMMKLELYDMVCAHHEGIRNDCCLIIGNDRIGLDFNGYGLDA